MNKEQGYLLSIESTGSTCGIALSRLTDGILLAEYILLQPNMHDKMLATLIRQCTDAFDITVQDCRAIAVSAGPGSFTGLRIGMAMAKGLCFDTTIPLICVPTLNALALECLPLIPAQADLLRIIQHSHGNTVYMADFDKAGNILQQPQACDINQIEPSQELCYAGTGAHMLKGGNILPGMDKIYPHSIAAYAYQQYKQGEIADVLSANPYYASDFIPTIKSSQSSKMK